MRAGVDCNMNKVIIISVLVVVFWLPYFTRSETAQNSVNKTNYGQRKFSIRLLRAFQKVQPNENFFFTTQHLSDLVIEVFYS